MVGRAVPPNKTVAPLPKFVPITVMLVLLDPDSIAAGLIALNVGTRLYVDPVTATDADAALLFMFGSFSEPDACTVIFAVPAVVS